MTKLAVYLAEGFEEIEAITIIDVLRRVQLNVTVISVSGKTEVTGSHNIKIIADEIFENVNHDQIDMIILPGGIPGANNLNHHVGLREQILNFRKNEKHLAAICAAPIIFGNLGILKNENATCYPGFENQLHGAIVTGEDVEVSNKIVTGKGAGVALKFSFKIVELFKGKKMADELARKMIVE